MNGASSTLRPRIAPGAIRKLRMPDRFARRLVLNRLRQLTDGEILLVDGDLHHRFGKPTERCPLSVIVHVESPAFYSEIAFGGALGAGEAYMAGFWHASDLTALVRILTLNRSVLDGMNSGLATLTVPLQKILHWLNRNTRTGSRRNIAAHYDLGNDLFSLMLDRTMMYSSAIFPRPDATLHEAQLHRLDVVCQKLDLKPDDHLLEIGTGWGGLALHAAGRYGCRVTTTTLSREQYRCAIERVEAAGLQDRVTILLKDYRELEGSYDKLVSIEMIEAVGHQYYDDYFQVCGRLLKDEGMMLLQAITIADQRYNTARKTVDFIKRYIFPGSCIPSVTRLLETVTQSSDLRLFDLEDIGPHYATTLRLWRENMFRNRDKLEAMGYGADFLRMWEFYLSYCEGGFLERAISDVHMLLVKPGNRRPCLE